MILLIYTLIEVVEIVLFVILNSSYQKQNQFALLSKNHFLLKKNETDCKHLYCNPLSFLLHLYAVKSSRLNVSSSKNSSLKKNLVLMFYFFVFFPNIAYTYLLT